MIYCPENIFNAVPNTHMELSKSSSFIDSHFQIKNVNWLWPFALVKSKIHSQNYFRSFREANKFIAMIFLLTWVTANWGPRWVNTHLTQPRKYDLNTTTQQGLHNYDSRPLYYDDELRVFTYTMDYSSQKPNQWDHLYVAWSSTLVIFSYLESLEGTWNSA